MTESMRQTLARRANDYDPAVARFEASIGFGWHQPTPSGHGPGRPTSVVIPARDVAYCLPAVLDALAAQQGREFFEVILVDDASRDGTLAIAQKHPVVDHLIRAGDWLGAAASRNIGTAVASGETILYLDADMVLPPHVVSDFAARADDTLVLVGFRHNVVGLPDAAPDTFLGPAVQTASQAITAGEIGEPLSADAALLSCGPENWHPAPEPFYAAGLGPLLDMGPYYLSVLTYLLGPVTHVVGSMTSIRSRRTIRTGPRAGEHFVAGAPTRIDALFRTGTGLPVTFTASFDTVATVRPHIEIYGSEATLQLPDPNFHDGQVRLRRRGQDTWSVLPTDRGSVSGRGMGVVDLADAIAEQRPHRAAGERARHVLAITEAIHKASLAGRQVAVRGL
jgi:hypothetical protein